MGDRYLTFTHYDDKIKTQLDGYSRHKMIDVGSSFHGHVVGKFLQWIQPLIGL